jgi:plasmid stabilization system protein ParE
MFRPTPADSDDIIEVLRVLHDSMDLARHFDAEDEQR